MPGSICRATVVIRRVRSDRVLLQSSANQANSKLSTGATTDAGKQTVSKNSLKHGLSSPNPVHVILPGEEDPFAAHLEGYMQAYAPVGVPEQDLVRSLASNNWRLSRCHSMERALYSHLQKEVAEGAETAAETLRELNRTAGYAHKIERAIEKTRNELKSLQAKRKAAYETAQKEAMLLTQLAHAKGQPPINPRNFRLPNSAVASFTPCPKSLVSSVAPPAWRKRKPASSCSGADLLVCAASVT